jgi:hypothetical protein
MGFEPNNSDLMEYMAYVMAEKYARIKNPKFAIGDEVVLNTGAYGLYAFYLRHNRGLPRKARQEILELMSEVPLRVADMEMLDDDGKSFICYTCFGPTNRIYVIPQHFLKRYEEE